MAARTPSQKANRRGLNKAGKPSSLKDRKNNVKTYKNNK